MAGSAAPLEIHGEGRAQYGGVRTPSPFVGECDAEEHAAERPVAQIVEPLANLHPGLRVCFRLGGSAGISLRFRYFRCDSKLREYVRQRELRRSSAQLANERSGARIQRPARLDDPVIPPSLPLSADNAR